MPNYKKIYFRLFGNFDILVNKKSVLSKGFRQQGFNRLFVFFLLNRDRVFEINTLIEKVWPNKEYHDNNSIMRTQIFRLKRQLAELVPSLSFRLEFKHGGYCFSYDPKNVMMDTEIFESICGKIFSSAQANYLTPPDTDGPEPRLQQADYGQGGGGAPAPQPSVYVATPAPTAPAYVATPAPPAYVATPTPIAPAYVGAPTPMAPAYVGAPTSTVPAFVGAPAQQPPAYIPGQPQPLGLYTPGRPEKPQSKNLGITAGGVQYSDGEILKLCSDALRIYQNGFLCEAAFDGVWLESYKQNYRRIWFRIIELFTDLCYRSLNFAEIISLCQEVLRFEDSEEYIHEIYMDALRKAGYHQDALKHYGIITSSPAHGERFAGSSRLRDLQRGILREIEEVRMIDGDDLEQFVMEITGESGAVVCEKDVFLRHCSVLRLHSERSTYLPYICIIETVGLNADSRQFGRLNDISYLTRVVRGVFRRSDIFCEWNNKQLLVLMACKQDFDADELKQRIKLAIIRDSLTPEEEANEGVNLSERMVYLPINVKIQPIGETRELSEMSAMSATDM